MLIKSLLIGSCLALIPLQIANSQIVCLTHDLAVQVLKGNFGQERIALGVVRTSPPQLMQIFLNKITGTFSVTLTSSSSEQLPTCLSLQGDSFEIDDDRVQVNFK